MEECRETFSSGHFGLQVRTHQKRWIDVAYIEGAIMNTGEWISQHADAPSTAAAAS